MRPLTGEELQEMRKWCEAFSRQWPKPRDPAVDVANRFSIREIRRLLATVDALLEENRQLREYIETLPQYSCFTERRPH